MIDRHDLVVVGGGPAGYAAALYGSAAGLDVGLVEERLVGGTCLHVGCIPAKELLETASVLRTVRRAGEFGIDTTDQPVLDLGASQHRKQAVIDRLFQGLGALLADRDVTVYDGTGRLGGDRTVEVTGGNGSTVIAADHVVLATGSTPRTLAGFDVDDRLVVTSDEFLSARERPDRVAVIGGGAVGCEFASMLVDFGSSVTLLEVLDGILPGCDPDVSSVVRRSFERRGIDVHTGVEVEGHDPAGGTTTVRFSGQEVEVDLVVVSVGRRPRGESADSAGTGVKVDNRGYIVTDHRLRTGEPGVYAAGDVIDTPQLAHVGFAEGMFVVQDLLGEEPTPIDSSTVPWCIYSHPEVAFAGLTEDAARAAGYEVVTSKHRFVGNGRAAILGDTDGLVKVVAEADRDGRAGRILGVHMAGPWVTEQIGQGYLAVNWEATVDEVASFVQPHPTLGELFGEALLSLTGRSLHG
ncbi:MAG: dihydrolipoyl dehydrogenase [Actinomycetota bacterium]|nr:dihydrolipoyl dehydrogenase [Actinomycetota bacterium]